MNDAATTAGPPSWKKGALVLFVVVAVLLALAALLLPKRQVESRNAPTSTQHRAASPGFNNPTH